MRKKVRKGKEKMGGATEAVEYKIWGGESREGSEGGKICLPPQRPMTMHSHKLTVA